jgi:rRNA maturation protein Nop10
MAWHVALATLSAALIGFLAGLLSFHMKQRWCPVCGATLTCPDPAYHSHEDPTTQRRYGHDSARLNAAPTEARRTPAVGHDQSSGAVRGAGASPGEHVGE